MEDEIFYCLVEAIDVDRDDLPVAPREGGYARLGGVRRTDFSRESLEKGVAAHIVDVFVPPDERWGAFVSKVGYPGDDEAVRWLEIRLRPNQEGLSYAYRAFVGGVVEHYDFISVVQVDGPALPDFEEAEDIEPDAGTRYQFAAYEVGQGMASLVFNDIDGFLLDAGAGTPLTRAAYLGSGFVNELTSRLAGIKVWFFLSHRHEDHWRMLVWSSAIETRVNQFILPMARTSIVFFDVTVRSRVRRFSSALRNIALASGQKLQVMRASPASPTPNNNGVVVLFDSNGDLGLAPGDCIYDDMRKDKNSNVRSLLLHTYKAVVVPHHGDAASAIAVPSGAGGKAFFSAGNHPTYMHPTTASTSAHAGRGFTNLINKMPTHVGEVLLI